MFVHLYNAIRDGLCETPLTCHKDQCDGWKVVHTWIRQLRIRYTQRKNMEKNRHETNIGPKGAAEDITAC